MNDEQTNFKVTDRRLFNSDGSPREVPENEKSEPQPSTNPAQPNFASAPAEAQPAAATQRQNDATPELPEAEDSELAGGRRPGKLCQFPNVHSFERSIRAGDDGTSGYTST